MVEDELFRSADHIAKTDGKNEQIDALMSVLLPRTIFLEGSKLH